MVEKAEFKLGGGLSPHSPDPGRMTIYSVPIHVELRVIHSDIEKITHTFKDKNVNSRTFFFSQNV